jgi:hypothetical protein
MTEDVPKKSTSADEASVGELVRGATEQISRLVRDELALARAEMAQKGKWAGVGAGLLRGGGPVALYGVAAVVLVLAEVMPRWLAALVVALVLLAVAGVPALLGHEGQAGHAAWRQSRPCVA